MSAQDYLPELQNRSSTCELCGGAEGLLPSPVAPGEDAAQHILICEKCNGALATPGDNHWYCLKEAVWSEVPAVQVQSYRMLQTIHESWAKDLLEQVYLMDEVKAWAEAVDDADEVITKDSNGTRLMDGDSVTLIKDLPVKGAGFTAKRGTMVRNIRLIGDPDNIEGKVNKTTLVLKTVFLKKA